MTEKIIHLKRIKCTSGTSSASSFLNLKKQDSILKTSSHKKHLSVRFSDQVPNRSLKTLSQDLDRISSAIDSTFLFKEKVLKKLPLSSQLSKELRESKSVPIEVMTQFSSQYKQHHASMLKEKHNQSVKTFEKTDPKSFYQRIQKDPSFNKWQSRSEEHKLDLKVIKKKIVLTKQTKSSSFQIGIGHSTKPKVNQTGSLGYSPKVVKSSVYLQHKKQY